MIASGTSPKGMRWRLKARLEPGRGLCDSFQAAAPGTRLDLGGSEEGCLGPEKDVTVSFGESGGPGNVPAVPEVAVSGAVAGRAAEVRLTLNSVLHKADWADRRVDRGCRVCDGRYRPASSLAAARKPHRIRFSQVRQLA